LDAATRKINRQMIGAVVGDPDFGSDGVFYAATRHVPDRLRKSRQTLKRLGNGNGNGKPHALRLGHGVLACSRRTSKPAINHKGQGQQSSRPFLWHPQRQKRLTASASAFFGGDFGDECGHELSNVLE
jgi:hypothetical protein